VHFCTLLEAGDAPGAIVPEPSGFPLLRSVLELVEFRLDSGDALELHVQGLMNFGQRRIKSLKNGVERRVHSVEPVTLRLDDCPIASRRPMRPRWLLRIHTPA
jgi:hypothetical protein